MTRVLALLRPEPGWAASALAARKLGLDVIGHPLFTAEPVAWEPPGGEFDALLVGSGATFRLGGEPLRALAHLPVHAVGEATAAAARAAGFTVTRTGCSNLQDLLDDTAGPPARLLRLAGEEHVAVNPHPGQMLTERAVYRIVPLSIDAGFARQLARSTPAVALHSAAAATHFARELDRLGIWRGALELIALAPRVAKAAGSGWAAVHIADRPSDAALLAKAGALCK